MKTPISIIVIIGSALSAFSQVPDSAVYFYQKGIGEKSAKRYLLAAQYFDRAIQLNPKYAPAFVQNGLACLEMRKTDAARQNFITALELEPGNTDAKTAMLDLYYSYHQYSKSLEQAGLCPECPNAERIMALSLYQTEEYTWAEKPLLKLIAQYPNDPELMYALGRSYMEMELGDKAVYYYEKAVRLDNKKATWFFELGMLYYVQENYRNAVINFNKAADNGYPKTNDFNENLGYAYLYSGNYDKGETMLLEVHGKIRGDKEIYRDLAQSYYDRKNFDKSLDYCQKIMEIDPKDAKALYQAGLCFQKKGEPERGTQMCDKAIELDPSLANLRTKKLSAGL